jgi:hypothetical protein
MFSGLLFVRAAIVFLFKLLNRVSMRSSNLVLVVWRTNLDNAAAMKVEACQVARLLLPWLGIWFIAPTALLAWMLLKSLSTPWFHERHHFAPSE